MAQYEDYKIKGVTLDKIANSIRRQHGFSDKINPEDFPLYISDKTNLFWVTHFNDNSKDLEGAGVIFTPNSGVTPDIRGWHRYIFFEKADIPNKFNISKIIDYGASSTARMAQITGVNLSAGTISSGASVTCRVPAVKTTSNGAQSVEYDLTTYTITGINSSITTSNSCVVFTSLETWSTSNPNWSCAIQLRPTATASVYSVVRQVDYPIEAVQNGNTAYTPTASDYQKLFHDTSKDGYRWWNGDIMLAAYGYAKYEVLFNYEPGDLDLGLDFSVPSNGFIYVINRGNDYPALGLDKPNYASSGATLCWSYSAKWKVGDSLIFDNLDLSSNLIPTSTPTVLWYNDLYVCTSSFNSLNDDFITIDGNLSDNGWGNDGWYMVSQYNGTYQTNTTNSVAKGAQYLYKIRTDDEYVYFGFSRFFDNVTATEQYASGEHRVRLWIKSNPEATLYTHFYDVKTSFAYAPGYFTEAKYNTSLTENSAAVIADTSLEAKATINLSRVVFEFKVKLSEFNGTESFECYVNYAYGESGTTDGYFTLYNGIIPKPADNNAYWFPYNNWYSAAAVKIVTADEEIDPNEAIALLEEVL